MITELITMNFSDAYYHNEAGEVKNVIMRKVICLFV